TRAGTSLAAPSAGGAALPHERRMTTTMTTTSPAATIASARRRRWAAASRSSRPAAGLRGGVALSVTRRDIESRLPRRRAGRAGAERRAALPALGEVDDQRHALEPVPGAQPVLEEVRVVAGETPAVVDLDREPRRSHADLRHVEQLEALALARRRLTRGHEVGQEAVELGRGDPLSHPVAERDRLGQYPREVAARLRARREHSRAQAPARRPPRPLTLEIQLAAEVPLLQHECRDAAALHRK